MLSVKDLQRLRLEEIGWEGDAKIAAVLATAAMGSRSDEKLFLMVDGRVVDIWFQDKDSLAPQTQISSKIFYHTR